MADDVQDAGTDTTDAGGTQTADTGAPQAQPTAASTAPGDTKPAASETPEVDYTIEAPEGVQLDQAQVDAFKALAKEHKLPADAAKQIADIAIKAEQQRQQAFAAQVEEWGAAVAADKDLGKPESLAAMRRVVDTYGTPELKTLLNTTGMGNHPEVARFVHAISKALSEDAIHGRSAGEAPARDAASILYPSTTKA